MYLAKVIIKNFRIIKNLELCLNEGLNILLGENDSGKTALIDAIRFVLGSRDNERNQISSEDFYLDIEGRQKDLSIQLIFEGLTDDEAPLFLEWLEITRKNNSDSPSYYLRITLNAQRKDLGELISKFDREIFSTITAGSVDIGLSLPSNLRDLLRVTYLKPLRDAVLELTAKKGSRLSQILISHPDIRSQEKSIDPNHIPQIVISANEKVRDHPSIKSRIDSLNKDYLNNFKLSDKPFEAGVNISNPSLKSILERLELSIVSDFPDGNLIHGLGMNNLLFMATEMLLLGSVQSPELPLLLIEEPEAHLHPQLQLRLMDFLQEQTKRKENLRTVQVIITSHSPNLASKVPLEDIVIVRSGQTFPLNPDETKLASGDYRFLQNFLDVTKSNLFFARGVIIVEGVAEQILLPTIAKLIGLPLEKFGVSIINTGSSGLFRYARIFQRQSGKDISIRVACVGDLDCWPRKAYEHEHKEIPDDIDSQEKLEALRAKKEARAQGGPVRVFISPRWTLEYDMCTHNCVLGSLVHQAVKIAQISSRYSNDLDEKNIEKVKQRAIEDLVKWMEESKDLEDLSFKVYKPLYEKKVSKAEAAQFLAPLVEEALDGNSSAENELYFPSYLIEAIKYATGQ